MSEYIIKAADLIKCNGDSLFKDAEEIVRCRDCWHSFADGTVCWNPMFVHSELFEGEWDDFPADVKPDGFCAWGERKEGGDE